MRRLGTLVTTVIVGLAVAAGSATAAEQIGIQMSSAPTIGYAGTQIQAGTKESPYLTKTSGVVTKWGTYGSGGTYQLKLKTALSDDATNTNAVVSESSLETVTATGLQTFPARIPIPAKATIGLYSPTDAGKTRTVTGIDAKLGVAYKTGDTGISGIFGGPEPSTSGWVVLKPAALNLFATVEPDADFDTYGDETQDKCPGVKGTIDGCLPPVVPKPKPKPSNSAKEAKEKAKEERDKARGDKGSKGGDGPAAGKAKGKCKKGFKKVTVKPKRKQRQSQDRVQEKEKSQRKTQRPVGPSLRALGFDRSANRGIVRAMKFRVLVVMAFVSGAVALWVPAAGAADDPLGLTTLEQRIVPSSATGFSQLTTGPGQGYVVREEGMGVAQAGRETRRKGIAYFGQLSDFQLADEESPARVEFVDRLGGESGSRRPSGPGSRCRPSSTTR